MTFDIPDDLFHVSAELLPRVFTFVKKNSGLKPVQFYVLLHIRKHARQRTNGDLVCMRHELTKLLEREFEFQPKNVTTLLNGLHNAGLIESTKLTKAELKRLYNTERGRTGIIVLRPEGVEKIYRFKAAIQHSFGNMMTSLPPEISGKTMEFISGLGYLGTQMFDSNDDHSALPENGPTHK